MDRESLPHLSARLSDFELRWLAEALQMREARDGLLPDADALPAARAAGPSLEARVLQRARVLGARNGLVDRLVAWRKRARVALSIAAALALLAGFSAAVGVLGDGSRPVNVLWAVGGLLGVHLLSLALWVAALGLGGDATGGIPGRLWWWAAARLPGAPRTDDLGAALARLAGRARLVPWWLGAVTHGVWLAALTGAVAGLLFAFSLRGYDFMWETTILPADVFVRLVAALGWLPAQLGFAVPDVAQVRASGAGPVPDAGARIVWSSWLIGCVMLYGVVPRLLLCLACAVRWHAGRRRVRLDLTQPGYAALRDRLMPASERMGIIDAAPSGILGPRHDGARSQGAGRPMLVGFELADSGLWPPALPEGIRDGGLVDSREERRRLLESVKSAPPPRLLVACDVRLTPDRGSLRFLGELAAQAASCGIWLLAGEQVGDASRRQHWRTALLETGFAPDDVVEDQSAALAWLGSSDVERRAV